MTLHVLFTADGIPGWIGFEPREGSEEMPATVKVGKADVARRERLFDRLVDVAARLDPAFAAAVADLEAEFKDTGE